MAKKKRDIHLYFMVSEQERKFIDEKMAQLDAKNMEAYLR